MTGANAGLGLGFARGMAKAGADVVIWGRRAAKNEEAAEDLRRYGTRVLAQSVDVSDEQQVVEGMIEAANEMGRLDCVVANAGISSRPPSFHEMPSAEWHALLDVSLHGAFYTFREAVKHMVARADAGDPGRLARRVRERHELHRRAAARALRRGEGRDALDDQGHRRRVRPLRDPREPGCTGLLRQRSRARPRGGEGARRGDEEQEPDPAPRRARRSRGDHRLPDERRLGVPHRRRDRHRRRQAGVVSSRAGGRPPRRTAARRASPPGGRSRAPRRASSQPRRPCERTRRDPCGSRDRRRLPRPPRGGYRA